MLVIGGGGVPTSNSVYWKNMEKIRIDNLRMIQKIILHKNWQFVQRSKNFFANICNDVRRKLNFQNLTPLVPAHPYASNKFQLLRYIRKGESRCRESNFTS
mgnify:CR=1 FL=1